MKRASLDSMEQVQLDDFLKEHSKAMKNPVLEGFLRDSENLNLVLTMLSSPTKENNKKLDEAFKGFLVEIRLVKYLSQVIRYRHLNLNKSFQKHRYRFPLYLDQEVKESSEDYSVRVIDTIPSSGETFENNKPEHLEDLVGDEKLYRVLRSLTGRQKEVLNLYYLEGFNDREISEKFFVSQQSIAKTRRSAMVKVRNLLKGESSDEGTTGFNCTSPKQ